MSRRCGWRDSLRRLFAVCAVGVALSVASGAEARTPTPSPGDTPTPTPTSNRPHPRGVIAVSPNPVRSGDRVFLDGSGSTGAIFRYEWRQLSGPGVAIDDADHPRASFVAPAVEELSTVTIQLFLPSYGGTPAGSAMVDVTVVPAGAVLLDVGSVTGIPVRNALVPVTLTTFGEDVGTIEHDLAFERLAPVVAGEDGEPDCSAAAGATGAFAFLPDGCNPERDCNAVHVRVSSETPLGDGELYRCRVRFSNEPSDVCEHRLGCESAQGATTGGDGIAVACGDGEAVTEFSADARVDFMLLEVSPAEPHVGDEVTLRFFVAALGSIPTYGLSGAAPYFSGVPPVVQKDTFGDLEYTVRAECPGTADLKLAVTYETRQGCVGHEFFGPLSATSQVFPVRITDPNGYSVSGQVVEFPDGCGGAVGGATVTLEPLGRTAVTDESTGAFSFSNVQPGQYTLTVSPDCNASVCWPDTELTVDNEDVSRVICPLPLGVTPTETPTTTPTPSPTEAVTGVPSSTPTVSKTIATATPTTPPVPPACVGDCDDDGEVTIAELIRVVNIGLGRFDVDVCPQADFDGDGNIVIEEMIRAVQSSLGPCRPL